MKHPAELCALSGVLSLLTERAHDVHLAFGGVKTAGSQAVLERLADEHSGLTFGSMPRRVESPWGCLSEDLRRGADYLRYLEPVYANAPKLRARRERGTPATVLRLARAARLAGPSGVAALRRTLQSLERCIIPPPELQSFVAEHDPDVVLGTHLETIGSGHADLVRAAKLLGIRTGYLVYSWDNLTNKGLIRDVPDMVLVWNDLQAREARELHGVPGEKVRVTGAASYDHWFSWSPSRGREEFLRLVGLRGDRPIVLYVCSSKFIAPKEAAFVRRWVDALRARGGVLAEAGILVRPHPRNAAQWKDVRLAFPQVSVWPRLGQEPVDEEARRNYFDSIYHSAAVVGINTSAQIEGAIVGRPIHTLLAAEFRETQQGTLHFHYLQAEEFGHLHVARTMEEHAALLEASICGDAGDDANERFIRRFVRPFGLDVAATPLVVEAIEQLAAFPRRAPSRRPAHAPLIRLGLRPLAAASARRVERRNAADNKLETATRHPRHVVHELAEEPSGAPIVAGPWPADAIGELLYWIPFLRWAQSATIGLRDRLVVVARAERAYWYAGIGSRRLLLEELESGGELAEAPPAEALSAWLAEALGVRNGSFRLLAADVVAEARAELARESPASRLRDRQLEFEPLAAPEPPRGLDLPDDFTAVRFRFGPAFPESEANEQLVISVVTALAASRPLVVIDPAEPVREALATVGDDTNLRFVADTAYTVRSAVLARSSGFAGSYGTTAYLAALHGTPAVAIYTDPDHVDADDLRLASSFLDEPCYGHLHAAQVSGVAEEAASATAELATRLLEHPAKTFSPV